MGEREKGGESGEGRMKIEGRGSGWRAFSTYENF
jgi:hypothetical protein